MKELFRNEGLGAIVYVNTTLSIKSTNRKDDQPAPEGIANLGKHKSEFTEVKSAKKLEPIGKWRADLQAKESQETLIAKELAVKSEKVNTDTTLDTDAKQALRLEIRRDIQSRQLLRNECEDLKRTIRRAGEFSSKEIAKIAAKASKKAGYGNCEEKAAIAYFFLRDRGIRPIELMASGGSLENPSDSHQFVVIGRKKDEDVDNPDAWTEAAVCDPWDNSVYEPSALPNKLIAFGYIDTINPCVREDS